MPEIPQAPEQQRPQSFSSDDIGNALQQLLAAHQQAKAQKRRETYANFQMFQIKMARKKQQPSALKLTRAMKVREGLMKNTEKLQALNTARAQHHERVLGQNLENELSKVMGDIGTLRNGHEIIRRRRLQDRATFLKRQGVKAPALKLDLR